jgi:hypothetical protein
MRAQWLAAILAVGLGGCGGSPSGGGGPKPRVPDNSVDYTQLKPSEPSEAPLALLSGDDFERLVKNGLRLQVASRYEYADGAESDGIDFSASPDGANGGDNDRYSDTNVHVEGVGESDVAKYDGRHWFVAYQPQRDNGELPGVQIIATDPDIPDASIVGSYSFEDGFWGPAYSLYLQKDNEVASHLIAMRSHRGAMPPELPGWGIEFSATDMSIWPGPGNSELKIEFIDVNQPATPALATSISLDGTLIDSRRVGDTLYVITRYDPWLAALQFEELDGQARSDNEAALSGIELAGLLPQYRQGDMAAPLSDDCYAPSDTQPEHGYYSMVNITAIDLTARQVVSSECLSTGVNSMTMSPNALYLTSNDWRESESRTVIHKFDLTDSGASYRATTSVLGHINGDAPYRVNEYNGDLRVVTTRGDWNQPSHHLSILRQSGSGFDTVAELPSSARPDPIGKPGEDIYAVRFSGPTAYVVTFERVDPLYVLDLSDSADPKISGELEVPGFATYIHPLNDNYLFTLGQDADNQTGWTKGIKAQLVKVDAGTPELVGEMLIGERGSHSDALHDLRALNFLPVGDGDVRVSFPVSVNSEPNVWQYSGLQMLSLTGLDGPDGAMIDKSTLIAETAGNNQYDYSGGVRRGLLHDEAVYYAHDNQVWFSGWGAADASQGPIGGEPIACTEEIRYGLNIDLWVDDESIDACAAQVVATDGEYSEELQPKTGHYGPGGCYFYGAPERAGSYSVTATLDGFTTQTQTDVVVSEDVCHVQPRWLWFNWPRSNEP